MWIWWVLFSFSQESVVSGSYLVELTWKCEAIGPEGKLAHSGVTPLSPSFPPHCSPVLSGSWLLHASLHFWPEAQRGPDVLQMRPVSDRGTLDNPGGGLHQAALGCVPIWFVKGTRRDYGQGMSQSFNRNVNKMFQIEGTHLGSKFHLNVLFSNIIIMEDGKKGCRYLGAG